MSRFNLIDEKWIPVRFPDGEPEELGIRETLLRAKDIATIEDLSPLVVTALHRFLLAVLYRALEGPTDIEQAKQLFRDGLPVNKITDYLNTWKPRFWLFDEKYPFGQVPSFQPKKWRAWTALAVEYNADTAKVLFDHTNEAKPGSIKPAAAARWLLATQTFAVSTGKSELSHTGTAPSAGSMMAIPIGQNLKDTLIFSLVPQNRLVMQDDIPLWEREPESLEKLKTKIKITDKKTGGIKDRAIEREAAGICDLYTWQTRSILFKETLDGDISELGFASGIGYKESVEFDPMLGFTIKEISDEGTKEKVKKKMSLRLEEKGIWRDFDSLLPDSSHLAPRVIENAVELTKRYRDRLPKGVLVLGQRYYPPRPNIAYWRKEYFALPEAIAGNRIIRSDIRRFLDTAEDAQKALWFACSDYARELLSHGARKPDGKDITAFIAQMPCIPWYWSSLEAKFHEILQHFTFEKSPYEIELEWLEAVRGALKDAWEQHRANVSMGDAWAIRAVVKAEASIGSKLKELGKKIFEFKESLKEEGV